MDSISLEFLETPGHTPEAMSVLAYDLSKQQSPVAELQGGYLAWTAAGLPVESR